MDKRVYAAWDKVFRRTARRSSFRAFLERNRHITEDDISQHCWLHAHRWPMPDMNPLSPATMRLLAMSARRWVYAMMQSIDFAGRAERADNQRLRRGSTKVVNVIHITQRRGDEVLKDMTADMSQEAEYSAHEMLARISPERAELLRLTVLDGVSGRELAAECGVNQSTMSRRYTAATRELRDLLTA